MITIYFVADDDHAAERVLASGPTGEETAESEVDPEALASLDAWLTGRDLDDLLSDDDHPRTVAEAEGRQVVGLDRRFTRAFATADLDDALATWLESEDVEGADPDELSDFLSDLQRLCIDAGATQQVYCWIGA